MTDSCARVPWRLVAIIRSWVQSSQPRPSRSAIERLKAHVPVLTLERLWNVEHFDRIVIPAPAGREPGFTPKELLWMLLNAPGETLILRPDPALRGARNASGDGAHIAPRLADALVTSAT